MRVLLVDDDDRSLEVLGDLLARSGYGVSHAASDRQALQLLENGSFRLVITEWRAPNLDALELCRNIRSNKTAGYVYTIILSDRSDRSDVAMGLSAGADDYVCKPYHAPELLLRVSASKRIAALGASEVAVFALAKLAESRDPETGQHLERMRNYCWILARWLRREFLEITDEFVDTLYQTSTLHDIGKVGIPDSVLLKPGRLTASEFEVMKTHTNIGAQTLSAAMRQFPEVNYLAMARDIALTHHECFDGSGYPQGLRGTQIPLCGRIVALADVYDALTSQRPYKAAYEHEVARRLILETLDRFDPRVLTAFLELESEFVAIRDAFSDAGHPTAPAGVNADDLKRKTA
jgi:putative two-component system response regulator